MLLILSSNFYSAHCIVLDYFYSKYLCNHYSIRVSSDFGLAFTPRSFHVLHLESGGGGCDIYA